MWVEYGVSVRDLSLQEVYAARKAATADPQQLACAEIPGLKYTGETNFALVREAHRFFAESTWPPQSVVDATLARMECS